MTRACVAPLTVDSGVRAAVIERHWQDIRRFFVRRIGSAPDAEDLAQEVCLRYLCGDDAISPLKPLAYLYGIAAHVLADHRTHVARRAQLHVWDGEAEELMEEVSLRSEWASDEQIDLQQRLVRAFSRLPPTHAAVLLAHKREGLSYVEVARALNLSINTVEKYVTQAKAQLRSMRCLRELSLKRRPAGA